jgi:hypothetical protein
LPGEVQQKSVCKRPNKSWPPVSPEESSEEESGSDKD